MIYTHYTNEENKTIEGFSEARKGKFKIDYDQKIEFLAETFKEDYAQKERLERVFKGTVLTSLVITAALGFFFPVSLFVTIPLLALFSGVTGLKYHNAKKNIEALEIKQFKDMLNTHVIEDKKEKLEHYKQSQPLHYCTLTKQYIRFSQS